MSKFSFALAVFLALFIHGAIADESFRGEQAARNEAVEIVKKGVDYIKANGTSKSYALIDAHAEPFVNGNIYIMVYGLDGMCLAHGSNEKLVGKNLIDAEDVDGKLYVKERVEAAKTKANFWLDYKFADPATKKIEPKSTYCQRLDDTVVCAGVYNPTK